MEFPPEHRARRRWRGRRGHHGGFGGENGIYQRLDSDVEGNEFLNQTSEAKLARAIDIGEDEDEDEEEDSAWESGTEEDGAK